jgi:hypothetical protein
MPATTAPARKPVPQRRDPSQRKDGAGDMQQAIIEDADKTEGRDRDLEHGEGGTLGLPSKPGELSQDD